MAEKSLKKNAILNVFRSILEIIFPLITFPYASRILLPEGTGKVNFTFQTVSLFSILSSLGITTYALREAAKIRDDNEKLSRFSSQIFTLNIFTMIFSYGVFFIALFSIPKYQDYRLLLLFASTEIFFITIRMNWFFQAIEEYTYITIQQIIIQIISLVILFVFVKKPDDVLQYACLSVFATTGSGVMNFIYRRKFIKLKFVNPKELLPHIKPILILSGATIATTIYTMLDTTMIGFLSDDRQIGLYTAAIKTIRMVTAMLAAVYGVLLPRLSYVSEKVGVDENYTNMVKKTINITEMLSIPTSIGIAILAPPVMTLLCGKEYFDSIFILQVLSTLVFVILSAGVLNDTIFTPMRKDKEIFFSVAIAAVVNIILNSILIPRYGALGAAIGTLTAESCAAIMKLFLARQYIKGNRFYSEIWKYFFASAIMGIGVYYIQNFMNNPILKIAAGIISGMLIYYLVLKIVRCQFLKYLEETLINLILRKK